MAEVVVERLHGEARRKIARGLHAFNVRRLPRARRYKRFTITLRDGNQIIGGVAGECWITVLFIQLLWLDEGYRNADHGTRLLDGIEAEARLFGATHAYVDTMSFQAPDFYRKCGYRPFGVIGGYPDGVTRHWLEKSLANGASS